MLIASSDTNSLAINRSTRIVSSEIEWVSGKNEGDGPHWTKLLDIHMMAYFAARQRTRHEYEALLRQSGFTFNREIDTVAGISLLEATAT